MNNYKLAIDIGGTFIDVVVFDFETRSVKAFKLPTTPDDPAVGVISAILRLDVPVSDVFEFIHGTTLGLNAVLERKGTTVGIITNEGFCDIFEIGRGSLDFSDMYRFDYEQKPPIVERRQIRGIAGRMTYEGVEETPLDVDGLVSAARELLAQGECKALAVSFLHSYANDAHERRAVEVLEENFPDAEISSGARLANEYREYERTSTAVLDAYIKPVLKKYLGRVSAGMAAEGFSGDKHVMNSSGGALTFGLAEAEPISTVLSGPAGGVSGALHVARATGRNNVISVDVGGTSLDACLIVDGRPMDVFEAKIDIFPILQPIFDLRTLGAGGGSIAWLDNKLLRVGPESAGAVPGPACYDRGGNDATVTDAALILGLIDTANFMGGEMGVAHDLAVHAIKTNIADPLGVSVEEAARSIFNVLISRTSSSIKEMMLEKGLDPRDFSMLAFGGCGPLFGPMLVEELEMSELVVPPLPSVFSAWGMLVSDLTFNDTVSVMKPLDANAMAGLAHHARELEKRSVEQLIDKVGRVVEPEVTFSVRLRFTGQEHTLSVDYFPGEEAHELFARFSAAHMENFGHTFDGGAEIVSLMVKLALSSDKPELASQTEVAEEATGHPVSHRMFDLARGAMVDCGKISRNALEPNVEYLGPLLVFDEGSSLAVFSNQRLVLDAYGMISVRKIEA